MKRRITAFIIAGIMALAMTSCASSSSSSANESSADSAASQTAEAVILGQSAEQAEKYTLYLGLNDKDTFDQKISTEDAIEKANKICSRHSGGYTQLTARGGWTNDDGTLGHENTLVYMIYDISESDLQAMLDEFLKEFNQSSVLVEKSESSHIYYSGK